MDDAVVPDRSNEVFFTGSASFNIELEKQKDGSSLITVSNRWISVKKKLPLIDEAVLISHEVNKESRVNCAFMTELKKWIYYCDCHEGSSPDYVTHWMPLPESPNE
jgi:hypothetical protein